MEAVKLSSENKLISSSWMCFIPFLCYLLIAILYHCYICHISQSCLSKICWTNIINSTNYSNPNLTVWSLLWFASTLASVAVWVLTVGVCQYIIWKVLSSHSLRKQIDVSFLTLASALLMFILHYNGLLKRWDFTFQLLEQTKVYIEHLPKLVKISKFFGFGVAVYFLFAVCTSLVRRGHNNPPSEEQYLADRIRYIRLALYFGASLLVIALIRKYTVHKLALAYLEGSSCNIIEPIANATVIFFGIFYSVFLAVIYIPTALILKARVNNLAAKVPVDKRNEYLSKYGLSPSMPDTLPRIVAILGPLLTSLATLVLEQLLKKL